MKFYAVEKFSEKDNWADQFSGDLVWFTNSQKAEQFSRSSVNKVFEHEIPSSKSELLDYLNESRVTVGMTDSELEDMEKYCMVKGKTK
jgi:hypothetical protein